MTDAPARLPFGTISQPAGTPIATIPRHERHELRITLHEGRNGSLYVSLREWAPASDANASRKFAGSDVHNCGMWPRPGRRTILSAGEVRDLREALDDCYSAITTAWAAEDRGMEFNSTPDAANAGMDIMSIPDAEGQGGQGGKPPSTTAVGTPDPGPDEPGEPVTAWTVDERQSG